MDVNISLFSTLSAIILTLVATYIIRTVYVRYGSSMNNRAHFANTFFSNAEIIDFCTKWSKVNIVKYVHPTAIISYTREYFVKGSIRATVNYNVNGKRFAGKNQIRGAQHSYGVLEFKYERNKEQEMRRLYTSLNLPVNRITKSSKYANTLIRW